MKAVVVVESMWGNTRAVAGAVAEGLPPGTAVVDVGSAPPLLPDDLDLLVVGGPTHAFSMSRAHTRHDAVQRGATEVSATTEATGVREWLASLSPSDHVDVATFDTRVASVRKLPGSAARAAGRQVRHHHLGRLVDTESFYVEDTQGPLLDGELERARAWGSTLAQHTTTAP